MCLAPVSLTRVNFETMQLSWYKPLSSLASLIMVSCCCIRVKLMVNADREGQSTQDPQKPHHQGQSMIEPPLKEQSRPIHHRPWNHVHPLLVPTLMWNKCWGARIRPLSHCDQTGKQTESDESEGKPGSHKKLEMTFHDLKHGLYKNNRQWICCQHFTCRLSNFLASKLLDLRLCSGWDGCSSFDVYGNAYSKWFPQKNLLMRRPGCFQIWDTGWNRWSLLWRKPWRPEDGRQKTLSLESRFNVSFL